MAIIRFGSGPQRGAEERYRFLLQLRRRSWFGVFVAMKASTGVNEHPQTRARHTPAAPRRSLLILRERGSFRAGERPELAKRHSMVQESYVRGWYQYGYDRVRALRKCSPRCYVEAEKASQPV
jgi:hypothetical protein